MPPPDQQNWATKTINRMVHALAITVLLFTVQSYLLPLRQQWIPEVIEALGIDYQAINWSLSIMNVIANDAMTTLGIIAIGGCTLALCYLVMLKIADLIAGIAALRHRLIPTVLTVVLSCIGIITGIPISYFLNIGIQVWERWLQHLYLTAERWSMRRLKALKKWIVSRYQYHEAVWDDELRAESRAEGVAEGRAEGVAEGHAKGVAEGRAEGVAEGHAKGVAEGRAKV